MVGSALFGDSATARRDAPRRASFSPHRDTEGTGSRTLHGAPLGLLDRSRCSGNDSPPQQIGPQGGYWNDTLDSTQWMARCQVDLFDLPLVALCKLESIRLMRGVVGGRPNDRRPARSLARCVDRRVARWPWRADELNRKGLDDRGAIPSDRRAGLHRRLGGTATGRRERRGCRTRSPWV